MKKWILLSSGFLLIIITRIFVVQWLQIQGNSMHPYIRNGDIVLVWKWNLNFQNRHSRLKKNDVVATKLPTTEIIVKRIAGVPGDRILVLEKEIIVGEKSIPTPEKLVGSVLDSKFQSAGFLPLPVHSMVIPENYYFLIGENLAGSTDSRVFGLIPNTSIQGEIIYP